MFLFNSLDHVDGFEKMNDETKGVTRPGRLFLLEMNHPPETAKLTSMTTYENPTWLSDIGSKTKRHFLSTIAGRPVNSSMAETHARLT